MSTSVCYFFCPSFCLSVWPLCNISHNHCVKYCYLQESFSFLQNSDYWIVSRVKGERMAQNDRKILSVALHISGTIHHMIAIYGTYTCVKRSYLQITVSFFQNFDLQCCWGKRAKSSPKWQKFCLTCSIFQEPFLIWLSFMVHLLKWWYLLGYVSFFQNFAFLGCKGGKRVKNGPKQKKIMCVALDISKTIHHMIVICSEQG